MKYRIIERELKNGTKQYVVQTQTFGFFGFEDFRTFLIEKDAIALRDRMVGLEVKSEKEIK